MMFAKLSVFALCASLASALSLSVPQTVDAGEAVPVTLSDNSSQNVVLELVNLALDATVVVTNIAEVVLHVNLNVAGAEVPASHYVVKAVDPTTREVIAESNEFNIVDA